MVPTGVSWDGNGVRLWLSGSEVVLCKFHPPTGAGFDGVLLEREELALARGASPAERIPLHADAMTWFGSRGSILMAKMSESSMIPFLILLQFCPPSVDLYGR